MIAEKLRKAVLQAAMEGKLTEQLSDDGNAIEYITKYKIKKINDIADFPKIPKSWIYTNLGEIGIWKAGSTPLRSKTEYYQNGNIPWLKTGDLNNGIIYDIPECITEKALNETSLKLNPVGSILMAMYGATIGKLGILGIEATTNQACIACITKDFVYNKFLFYYLYSEQDKFIKKGVGGAQPNISREKIVATEFPLPPIEEQKRIVEKLEVLLAEINKLEEDDKALKELEDKFPEKLKNAIMLSAIQGNLSQRITTKEESSILKKKILDKKEELIKNNIIRKEKQYPIEENEVFIIPDEWESIELADIVHFTKMIKKKTADKLPYLDVKSLRTNEYNNFRTNGEAVEAGDYAILVDGQNSGEIFKISKKGFLGSTLRKIVINPIIEHNYALLILDFYKNTFRDNKRGAAIPHLDFKIFNTSIVPLPSSIEQKHIIEKLDKIFAVDLLNI